MKKISRFVVKFVLWFLGITILLVLVYRVAPVPITPLMIIRYIDNPERPIDHEWTPIEKISPHLQLAVVASEDQNFLIHNGFDYQAIRKAFEENKSGRRIRGGSTISQQTAKNVFLWPQRSWIRKGLEVYFTFLIELFWNKERILEVYLNSIEMGQGVYGARAASQFWFSKEAVNLTPSQSASLAAILPNPRQYKASPASAYISERKAWILQQMRNLEKINF